MPRNIRKSKSLNLSPKYRVQWRPLADDTRGPANSRNSLWSERELDAVNRERNFYSGDFTIPGANK